MTGYQRSESMDDVIPKFIKYFNTDSKSIPFIQVSLRSAKEIFLEGGHSTLKLNERWFNLRYDHRREIIPGDEGYHKSKPFSNKKECSFYRDLADLLSKSRLKATGTLKGDAYLSLLKRMLVRICMNDPLTFGVKEELSRIEIIRLMKVVGLKTLPNFLSKQKDFLPIYHSVPASPAVLKVLEKFKCVFPDFPEELILRK